MPYNSTDYRLGGTKTFRRASKKILSIWGGNLQNIKKSMREIYSPNGFNPSLTEKCLFWLSTGDTSIFTEEELLTLRVFLQVDQSGAEALIVAYDSAPKDYRQLFIHNVKPHVYVALKLFKDIWARKAQEHGLLLTGDDIQRLNTTPIPNLELDPNWRELDSLIKESDDWSLSERYYYLAKQTVHSGNYEIQAARFRMNILEKSGGKIVISQKEAAEFLMMYRGLFPEIPESNRNIRAQIDKHRIIYNTLGFPYIITQYDITEHQYKEYFAWPRQSTVAEITRRAFSDFQHYIESNNRSIDLLADTHDSYLFQAPLTMVKEARDKGLEFMQQDLISPYDGTPFRMKAECQVGFNWGPCHKGTNELGLRKLKWL